MAGRWAGGCACDAVDEDDAEARRWFNILRNTVSDRILAVYRMDETPPTTGGDE